ncbi:rhodanese-like domain-containing protein [Planktosalinus lacus]|uniref:rhodanese-like domain-containing protein n=1 Tax=Planktosalinus lacus TaxID=1526573 RepID=UPI001666D786|nr:rhodanese-like domain-containing protein [Planktosalinus lacus]
MKHLLYILLFTLSFQTFSQETLDDVLAKYTTGSVPYISVEQLQKTMKTGEIIVLDAREKEEFAVSHLSNSIWVGFDSFSLEQTLQKFPDKNAEIVVYCSVGVRSEKIGEKLQKAGYTQVKNLYGGIFAWKNNNLPVYDRKGNKTEKIHAYSKKWGKWLETGEKKY